ncbi:hypothetical protein HDU78_005623 [Chytriomyces hyalinus]|nr:hypothetical protein HDU78_005623 [Chytriomyces hyalinus]
MAKWAQLCLVAATTLCHAVQAVQSDGVIRLGIEHASTASHDSLRIARIVDSMLGGDNTNGIDLGTLDQSMLAASNVEKIPLLDKSDTAYYAVVQLGTPGQRLRVIADTGSNALWAGSASCNLLRKCADSKEAFNETRSSTYSDLSNKTLSKIEYGSGKVSGYASNDTLQIGQQQLNKTGFLLVMQEDAALMELNNGSFNGVMGLAHVGGLAVLDVVPGKPNLSTKTIMHHLIEKGLLAQPVFSLWLGTSGSDSENANGGEMTLGGIDTARIKGDVFYTQVSKAILNGYFWSPQLNMFSIAGKATTLPNQTYAIVDSGTSYIHVDRVSFNSVILPALQAGTTQATGAEFKDGSIVVPCANAKYLPSFGVSFSDKNSTFLTIDASQLVLKKSYMDEKGVKQQVCVVGITPDAVNAGNAGTLWVLGQVFLRSFYSVYDFSQGGRVGFAQLAVNATGTVVQVATVTGTSPTSGAAAGVSCLSVVVALSALLVLQNTFRSFA